MMQRAMAATILLAAFPLAGALFCASPAAAQSLFGSRGLGVPAPAIDGRIAALGGLGVALPGANAAMINPADASGTPRRGGIAALQPTTTELEVEAGSDGVDATRFPLVQALLPVGDGTVLFAGFGSFLDQNWGVERELTVPLGADTVLARDRITSDGGIAQVRVGASHDLTPYLSVGLSAGLLTGSRTRSLRRSFVGGGLRTYVDDLEVAYSAPLATVGVRWAPTEVVQLGGSVTWIGSMDADVDGEEDADDGAPDPGAPRSGSIDMPFQLAGGASAYLDADLIASVSGRWSGWSAAADDLTGGADDAWEVGGGLEYLGTRAVNRVFPIRLGARYTRLPFPVGGSAPTEWGLSAGLGALLAGTEEAPAAEVNGSLERGWRGSLDENGIEERFWRVTVSVALFAS